MDFQHPQLFIAFLAVPLLVLLIWNVLNWKKSAAKKIGDEKLVAELTKSHSPGKFLAKSIAAGFALVLIIAAIINPRHPGKMEKVDRKGVDVMIALDVSNSMLAEDIRPNRLEKARQLIYRLLPNLKNDRVGLVLFAGHAYMQMPLTPDHAAAQMYVQNASPAVVPTQGTVLSEALKLSASAFNSKDKKYKSIILITDGEDHDAGAMEVAEQLEANGIMINTIGIGSAAGTTVPDPSTGQLKKDDEGNAVVSRLNEAQLKQIAAATQGIYINSQNVGEAADAIRKKLSTIQQTEMEDMAFKDYVSWFPWLIMAAIILLVVEFLVPEARKMKLTLLLTIVTTSAGAQQADKLYRQGKYEQAVSAYGELMKSKPDPAIGYNQGNAFFRLQQFDKAQANYDRLIISGNDSLKQRALYNKGVSFSRQNKLEKSIDAYKAALRIDPADEDTRINLQKALLELKKTQPPQAKNDQQKKQKQEKDKKRQPEQMNRKDIERYLKALQQREQQVQQKMQQSRTRSASQPEKDW